MDGIQDGYWCFGHCQWYQGMGKTECLDSWEREMPYFPSMLWPPASGMILASLPHCVIYQYLERKRVDCWGFDSKIHGLLSIKCASRSIKQTFGPRCDIRVSAWTCVDVRGHWSSAFISSARSGITSAWRSRGIWWGLPIWPLEKSKIVKSGQIWVLVICVVDTLECLEILKWRQIWGLDMCVTDRLTDGRDLLKSEKCRALA